MTKNVECLAQTINGQVVHETDEKETIDNCFISKQTWNFLSCVLALHDLYGKVEDALTEMYGEERADNLIGVEYNKKSKELESVLYSFVNDSINENICIVSFNKI